MAPCSDSCVLSSLVQPGTITQLLGHWGHKLLTLLSLGYLQSQCDPRQLEVNATERHLWLDVFWGHLAALSEEEPACHVCFAAFYCKKSPWRDLYAVTCSAFLPKIQPVHAGALMWQVCLASGVISNYPNLGASSFRPVWFFSFFFSPQAG